MRISSRLVLLTIVGCTTLPIPGRADEPPAAPEELTHVQFDLDYAHYVLGPFFNLSAATFDNAAMAVEGQIDVHRHLALTLIVPWVVGQESDIAGTHALVGNIVVGAQGFGHVRPGVLLWGGVSGGIPTTYRYSSLANSVGLAAAIADLYNYHRSDPATASLRVYLGGEVTFALHFRYRFEAATTLLFAADAASSGSAPLPTAEAYNEIEALLPLDLQVGLRAQYWTVLTSTPTDLGFAGGAYLGYSARQSGVFLRLGFLLSPLLPEALNIQLRAGYQF